MLVYLSKKYVKLQEMHFCPIIISNHSFVHHNNDNELEIKLTSFLRQKKKFT